MSNNNQCAACGQWSGRGHRCPTPTTVTAEREEVSRRAVGTAEPLLAARVARAEAALAAAQAEAEAAKAAYQQALNPSPIEPPATQSEIGGWFDRGVKDGAEYMIVAVDGFDYGDYPVYVMPGQNVNDEISRVQRGEMQRVMEVYSLRSPKAVQLNEQRAYHTSHLPEVREPDYTPEEARQRPPARQRPTQRSIPVMHGRPRASKTYVGNTNARLNPADPDGNDYYQRGGPLALYIVQKEGSRNLKAFTGWGDDETWVVGAVAEVEADQSGRNLGRHLIVGKIAPDGTQTGEIPDKALPHSVFK